MNKKIAIITENFYIPWTPNDIDKFVAGCQESLILFSEELAKNNYFVVVFSNGPVKIKSEVRKGVLYTPLILIDFSEFDLLILFKHNPFPRFLLPKTKIIYWSSDIEELNIIENKVCLTQFHADMNDWKNAYVIPHGIDMNSLNENKESRDENMILYSSSPDRGLVTLIEDWKKIQTFFPNLRLYITYGFQIQKQLEKNLQIPEQSEKSLVNACNELNITFLPSLNKKEFESLYWKAKYWILPLNDEKSELFCLNAIKAQYCGCIPIVNKIGALKETVKDYIDYKDFVNGNLTITKGDNTIPLFSWSEVVKKWEKLFFESL